MTSVQTSVSLIHRKRLLYLREDWWSPESSASSVSQGLWQTSSRCVRSRQNKIPCFQLGHIIRTPQVISGVLRSKLSISLSQISGSPRKKLSPFFFLSPLFLSFRNKYFIGYVLFINHACDFPYVNRGSSLLSAASILLAQPNKMAAWEVLTYFISVAFVFDILVG